MSYFALDQITRKKVLNMKPKILIVDDDTDFVRLIGKYLQAQDLKIISANSAKQGGDLAKENDPDLVLLDVKLPDASGVDLVKDIKSFNDEIPIIMVSGSGSTKNVVAAMKAGASDYVQKPFDHKELFEKIVKLLEIKRAKHTEMELHSRGLYAAIIGKSPKTRQLIREISKVANSHAPVLLRGESGTGKSLIAEVIHKHSQKKDKPFVTINCAAIPENLLESELFGHKRGAFTGAISDKVGKFEYANSGTIFLDEIGDLSPELQVKILRVLQNGEFERVGGLKTIRVHVRIIAATNRNLDEAISRGRFREDLFYRLNVLPIFVPPLRERKEDIPILSQHFFKYYSLRANKHFQELSDDIIEHLTTYHWPGNIRELQNIIERAIVLGTEPNLRLSNFIISANMQIKDNPDMTKITSIRDLEYQALIHALKQTSGNISKASKFLGIGRDTFYRRLKKYKIGLKRDKEMFA